MENEYYGKYAIKNKLDSFGDNIISSEKRARYGKVKVVTFEVPNKEKSLYLIDKFMKTVEETGYDASVVDVKKLMLNGSYEHFLRVRLRSHLYYLSERGIDVITEMMRNNDGIEFIQHRASDFGIKKTGLHKRLMLEDIIACVDDPERVINEVNDMTDKELFEKYGDKI